MTELARLAEWIRRLRAVHEAATRWRALAHDPFSNALLLSENERLIGSHAMEILP